MSIPRVTHALRASTSSTTWSWPSCASSNIEPSPLSSDSEFIRRAYLDAAGILPDAGRGARLPRRPRPDKRARLIDALLERPEFVDYWAYKWSDLLLVSSKNLQSNAMWAYYDWIRDERRGEQAVGPVGARDPYRVRATRWQRRGQLLRPAQGSDRRHRERGA